MATIDTWVSGENSGSVTLKLFQALKTVETNETLIGSGTTGLPLGIHPDILAQINAGGTASINTDATLLGDGSIGSPLGVDVSQLPPATVSVNTATLEGNGSTLSPLNVKANTVAVAVNAATLTGNGTTASPLNVKPNTVAVTVNTARMQGNGTTASPLDVKTGSIPVTTDGVVITGNGTTASPITLDVSELPAPVIVTSNTTITGNGTLASPVSLNLVKDNTLTGEGTIADPLGVDFTQAPATTITTNSTLTGAGTVASPLVVNPNFIHKYQQIKGSLTAPNVFTVFAGSKLIDSTGSKEFKFTENRSVNLFGTPLMPNSVEEEAVIGNWYYVYVIATATGAPQLYFSTKSEVTGDAPIVMPVNYVYKRQTNYAFYHTNASGMEVIYYYNFGRKGNLAINKTLISNTNPTINEWATISLAPFLPKTANLIDITWTRMADSANLGVATVKWANGNLAVVNPTDFLIQGNRAFVQTGAVIGDRVNVSIPNVGVRPNHTPAPANDVVYPYTPQRFFIQQDLSGFNTILLSGFTVTEVDN